MLYPAPLHDTDTGSLLPGLLDVVQSQWAGDHEHTDVSAFDMKQSTMHDTAQPMESLFDHVRPTLVSDSGAAADTFAPDVVTQQALDNVLQMSVKMGHLFKEQFVS